MPSDKTKITELAPALGMLGHANVERALSSRDPRLQIDADTWDTLGRLHTAGDHRAEFDHGYANGCAFLTAAEGLRHRPPRIIQWTGEHRPPGDEVAPVDLAVDHVYLISCKYRSKNISSPSPARLFDGLLVANYPARNPNWYDDVAAAEHQQLYTSYRQALGLNHLPPRVGSLTGGHRAELKAALRGPNPPTSAAAYAALCRAVSNESARRWQHALSATRPEVMLWRLLRIGNAPYFLLGHDRAQPLRLRVGTAWDFRQLYTVKGLTITAATTAGQPRVDWAATYLVHSTSDLATVQGHIEIRSSHGRLAANPEAKVYLDTPVNALPGYVPLR
jgi:hypothetical protein